MLRVCCLTFDRTTNYGSCLQAYALKTAVDGIETGGEHCSYEMLAYGKIKDRQKHGKLINKAAYFLVWPFFSGFDRQNMAYANVSYLADIEQLNERYDAFICGSDVIWNPAFTYGSNIFFLKFASKYAFSYAASFGRLSLDQEYISSLEDRLSNLREISVREESAAAIINEHTSRHVRVVVDPVLLLSAEQWNKVAAEKTSGKGYIFVYATHITDTISKVCDRLSKQTGLRIIRASTNLKNCLKFRTSPCTPGKWVGLIRDAQYVVTNSYHATVFSTIYRKDFFTVVGEDKLGVYVRMQDFLSHFGLENRMICGADSITLEHVNYEQYNEKIDSLIGESYAYLQNNLDKACSEKKQSRG